MSWAETGLVVADEFRDGNVPAGQRIKELVDQAFAALPHRPADDPWQVNVRSDSAAYGQDILDHWHARRWRFAVRADLSHALHREIVALPPEAWRIYAQAERGGIREWAEVAYVPSRKTEKKDAPVYRYLAIRVRTPPQGVLFGDGDSVKHCAVVTNDWETPGQQLLVWQRGKAGTIEHVNHVLKNELAAGVYPSDKFGATAAWLRLHGLTLNLLEILKATALDDQYRRARPKRLRFAIVTQFGRVVRHARSQLLRLTTRALDALLRPGLRRIRLAAWVGP